MNLVKHSYKLPNLTFLAVNNHIRSIRVDDTVSNDGDVIANQ